MKWKNLVAASLLPLNVLLLFFLVFSSRLVVPAWLQVAGRLHPVILHFPIVLVLLYAALLLGTPGTYRQERAWQVARDLLLLAGAFTAAITALMGLLLSREPGYDPDSLAFHMYSGSLSSWVLFLLYSFRTRLARWGGLTRVAAILPALLVIWAGHLGASVTHGANFVLAPVTPEHKRPVAALEDAYIYADLVEPILSTKCMGCHNSNKAKGELIMETRDLLLKGGKDGKLWDTTKADLGLLMQRIHLPEEEKKHMPPSGKPQLTDQETAVLAAWIRDGSPFEKRVIELSPEDTLAKLAARILKQGGEEVYDFPAANEQEVARLSTNNRVVAPLAQGSPALVVNFYNKQFYNTRQLEELKPVANQIVELNLENMPVSDADLAVISGFPNLRRLILNFTGITGGSLGDLKKLQQLKSLALSGTPVTAAQLDALSGMPKLRTVYLWNTRIAGPDLAGLENKNRNVLYQAGFKGDSV
ncbi:MAG TPA: c-type cytochrome domain-containing protein, partial [Chitinophagaceae bacterium]|nr:c-type cytochrome domain-containing protein [Chitinophagaceae bacterium]